MFGPKTITKALSLASGVSLFYRETGDPSKPTILLLHGFPSSSHQYRDIIPLLSSTHHVVAPDYPGFGFTTIPESLDYQYTFANLTETILEFLDALKITKFAVYVFDYGAPVGFRIALQRPHAISAIITQSGNAYEEGLGSFWDPIKQFWKEDTPEIRKSLAAALLTINVTKFQYTEGVEDPVRKAEIPPESYTLDQSLLERPGQTDIQLNLFHDYQSNVALYPKFHQYLRSSEVPILAVWGKNDPIFIYPGAEAFARDVKDFQLDFFPTGHFALESFGREITAKILEFLKKRGL